MKKITLLFSILLLIATPDLYVFGEETTDDEQLDLAEQAKSAILIEQDTGKILFDKQANDKLPPASMTKIMTLLLTMEELDKGHITLNEKVQVSENAASMGGSQVFLEAGEEVTVEELIKSIAVASGNDASVAIAEKLAGSEEAFVKKMNEKASDLNLKNTKFQNSSGLPASDHYSTAHDMVMMARELLKYETVTDYTSIYEDYLRKGEENEFWLVNTNKLVKFYSGADGLKTGFTNEAKYCLTATAKKDGMRVISVVMGADTPKERNASVTELLDYAFSHYNTEKLHDKGDSITQLNFLKAKDDEVDVTTSQSVSVLFKKGETMDNIDTSYRLQEDVEIPLEKGETVGTLTVKNGDEVISETPLVVNEAIEQASYLEMLKRSFQKMSNYSE